MPQTFGLKGTKLSEFVSGTSGMIISPKILGATILILSRKKRFNNQKKKKTPKKHTKSTVQWLRYRSTILEILGSIQDWVPPPPLFSFFLHLKKIFQSFLLLPHLSFPFLLFCFPPISPFVYANIVNYYYAN